MERIRPEIRSSWLAAVSDGKRLEMSFTENDTVHECLTVFADEDTEQLYVEVEVGGRLVEIEARKILDALRAAEGEVHSERWYERNVYGEPEENDA